MVTLEAARGWGESGCLPSEVREISAEPMFESRPHRKNQLCGGQRKSTLNGGDPQVQRRGWGEALQSGEQAGRHQERWQRSARPICFQSITPTNTPAHFCTHSC